MDSLIGSFIHSFIRSFVRSFIHSFIRSFIHWFSHSLIHEFIASFIDSFNNCFTQSLMHSLSHSFFQSHWFHVLFPQHSPFIVSASHRLRHFYGPLAGHDLCDPLSCKMKRFHTLPNDLRLVPGNGSLRPENSPANMETIGETIRETIGKPSYDPSTHCFPEMTAIL